MPNVGDSVYTQHGAGRIVDQDTVRGRTSYKVAGSGFSVWVDATKVHTAENRDPSVDDIGRTNVNDDNDTTLPYDPSPQHHVDLFRSVQTIQPGEYEIDADDRLSPSNSLTHDDASANRPYPGPNPDLFAKSSSNRDAIDAYILQDRGLDRGTHDVDDYGTPQERIHEGYRYADIDRDFERHDQHDDDWYDDLHPAERTLDTPARDLNGPRSQYEYDNIGRQAFVHDWHTPHHIDDISDEEAAENNPDYGSSGTHSIHRPAGLSDRYAYYADLYEEPVDAKTASFRRDPSECIQRIGHSLVAGEEHSLDHEFEDYTRLLAADKQMRTAAWTDVRNKAMRLRREGKVQVNDLARDAIYATVEGDGGVYDTMILKGGASGQSISEWFCECPWGQHAFLRKASYIGRLCSHGYAAYLEMESQNMAGKPFGHDRTAGAVDKFKTWAGDNDCGRYDKDSIEDFVHNSDEDLSPEDIESLYDYVEDNPTKVRERDYSVPYTFDPDKVYKDARRTADLLRTQPTSLTPVLQHVESDDDTESGNLDDERETTGPDQIMYDGPGSHMREKQGSYEAIAASLHTAEGPHWWDSNLGDIGRGVGRGITDPSTLPGFGIGKDLAGADVSQMPGAGFGTGKGILNHSPFHIERGPNGSSSGGGGGDSTPSGGSSGGGGGKPASGFEPLGLDKADAPAAAGGKGGLSPLGLGSGNSLETPGESAPKANQSGGPTGGSGTGDLTKDTDYTVKPGDTLADIAERAGFGPASSGNNFQKLFDQNKGKPGGIGDNADLIHPGEKIHLRDAPGAGDAAAGPPAAGTNPATGKPFGQGADHGTAETPHLPPGPVTGTPGPGNKVNQQSANPLLPGNGPLGDALSKGQFSNAEIPPSLQPALSGAPKRAPGSPDPTGIPPSITGPDSLGPGQTPKPPSVPASTVTDALNSGGSNKVPPVPGAISGPANAGLGPNVPKMTRGSHRRFLAEQSSEGLLDQLREMSDCPPDEHYQNMEDFTDRARDIIEELNDRGVDASFMVANLHTAADGSPFDGLANFDGRSGVDWADEPFAGSGPNPKDWYGDSRDYVDDFERPDFEDVTDLGTWAGYNNEVKNPKKARRRSADAYAGGSTLSDMADSNPHAFSGGLSSATNALPADEAHTGVGGGSYPPGIMAGLHYAAEDDSEFDEPGLEDMNGGSVDILASYHTANDDYGDLYGAGAYSEGDMLASPEYSSGAQDVREGRKHNMKAVRRAGHGPRSALQHQADFDEDFDNGTNMMGGEGMGSGASPMLGVDGSALEVSASHDPVAAFQRSAGAQAIYDAGGNQSDGDIAQAAQRFLKTAGRHFSLAEQMELEQEEHPLGARNTPSHEDLMGTHYV